MLDLLDKKNMRVFAGIFIVFAVGLVGFYLFSADYGDGLEVTMENGGVSESEPVYSGPLDYGENYTSSLLMGIVGFFTTLIVSYSAIRILRKKNASRRD